MTIKTNVIEEYTAGSGVIVNNVKPKFSHQVFCMGDSLSANTYEDDLETLLGADWRVNSCGIGGETTAQMLARFAGWVSADAEYVVILAGVNDVYTPVATATIKSNLLSLYEAAAALGAKVVAVTITPSKTFVNWSAGIQTEIDDINTWILNTATSVDYAIDAYSDLEDPGAADTLLAAYDSGDHLHLSTAGYAKLAEVIEAGVTWTASTSTPAIAVGDASTIVLNQDVSTAASPKFIYPEVQRLTVRAIRPPANGVAAVQIQKLDGTNVFNIDTTNGRVGIGNAAPSTALDMTGSTGGAITLASGVVIQPSAGYFVANSTSGTLLQVSSSNIVAVETAAMRPGADGTIGLGLSNYRWSTIYGATLYATTKLVAGPVGSPSAGIVSSTGANTAYLFAAYDSSNSNGVSADISAPSDQGQLTLHTSGGAFGTRLSAYGNSYVIGYGGGSFGVGTTSLDALLTVAGDMSMSEMSAPTGVANKARIYAKDNGSGKTQLCCKLGDNTEIVLATQA